MDQDQTNNPQNTFHDGSNKKGEGSVKVSAALGPGLQGRHSHCAAISISWLLKVQGCNRRPLGKKRVLTFDLENKYHAR
jgi:hypothetical protein